MHGHEGRSKERQQHDYELYVRRDAEKRENEGGVFEPPEQGKIEYD